MKYLVDFKNTATDAEIQSYLSAHGCTVLKEWDNFDKVFLVEVASAPPVTDLTEHVVLEEGVAITPHYDINTHWGRHDDPNSESITVDTGNEQDWWKNYSYAQPVFDEPTLTLKRFGDHISVYVMDSGFTDNSNGEFAGVNVVNLYSILGTDFADCNGHGTAMSSLISGRTCGITNATIKVVKIFDDNTPTLQSQFLDALDAIIADHDPSKFGVVNCSWTIPKNAWIESKFRTLTQSGVYVVAAAGNTGVEIEDVTPASMVEALTVGAYNKDLEPCSFSAYSDLNTSDQLGTTNHGELDGWAPGDRIWSYGTVYGWIQGTSPAAAITSAIVVNNLHRYCGNTGSRLPYTHDWNLDSANPNTSQVLAFSRKDLLDLSDPKYANSVNKIATINDTAISPTVPPTDELNYGMPAGQKDLLGYVVDPLTTKSIVDITPLPSFCQLLPSAGLYASPSLEDGPQDGEVYKQYVWQFTKTNFEDVSETVTVNIYVTKEDFQPSDLPDDHVINITLAANCWRNFYVPSCTISTYFANCLNNCPNSQCCYHIYKSMAFCECTNAFSDRRLKSNIVRIGTHSLGIGLYEYDIFGKRTTGVMADELLEVMPQAVSVHSSGYYMVDYGMIGMK